MRKRFFVLVFLLTLFIFYFPAKALGAVLYLSPETGIYSIKSSFSIKIMLDTEGREINAVDGILNFNSEELEVIDVSKINSILSFWLVEPTFNNENGVIESHSTTHGAANKAG